MKIDISKFMMITALLASAGTVTQGCTIEDSDDVTTDGEAGATGEEEGGSGGDQSGSEVGGDAGEGGRAGEPTTEGAGGSAGEPTTEGAGGDPGTEGLGGSAGEGAGGEGGETDCVALEGADPTGEGFTCETVPGDMCDPATEGLANPGMSACATGYAVYKSGIAEAIEACIADASVGLDACGSEYATKVQECLDDTPDHACSADSAIATCTTLIGDGLLCDDISVERCVSHISAAVYDDAEYVVGCMDPEGEWYDSSFDGTCVERLDACLIL